MKRFGRFSNMISVSKKNALQNLHNNVNQDCQSTTGYNLLVLTYLLTEDYAALRITPNEGKHKDQPYYAVPPSETWRINFVKVLVNINSGRLHLNKFWTSPLEQILDVST